MDISRALPTSKLDVRRREFVLMLFPFKFAFNMLMLLLLVLLLLLLLLLLLVGVFEVRLLFMLFTATIAGELVIFF